MNLWQVMILQSSTISIEKLRIHAYHGVMAQEREVGADFLITLRVHYNINKAMNSDEVADTLNYALLCQVVNDVMAVPSRLLEHVAGRICRVVFRRFPQATGIELKLTKLNPPMGADCEGASVEVEVKNEE